MGKIIVFNKDRGDIEVLIEFPVGGVYRLTDFTLMDGEDGKWSRVEFLPGDVLLGVERITQPRAGWRYTVLRVCGHLEEKM